MGVDELVEIGVEDDVGRGEHHVAVRAALEHGAVLDEVADQETGTHAGGAEGGAGQDEQAAVLAGEAPLLAGAEVVGEGAEVLGHDHADGADAGVDHVGHREVDHAVAADIGRCGDGTIG